MNILADHAAELVGAEIVVKVFDWNKDCMTSLLTAG